MNINSCHICTSEKLNFLKTIEGYQKGTSYAIGECATCSTQYVEPCVVDDALYQLIYKNAKDIAGYNRYHRYVEEVLEVENPLVYLGKREAMYWAVAEVLKQVDSSFNPKILEVGSGLGYLTYALVKAGYCAKGMDISSNAVINAKAKFGDYFECNNIFDVAILPENQFDVIVLNEVIEHVNDPVAFIEKLLSLLTPEGKLVVTTPNKSACLAGSIWDTELPPIHLYWFSEKSMECIAERLDAKVTFLSFREFNRKSLNLIRFRNYKPSERTAILDENGNVCNPMPLGNRKVLNEVIKKVLLTAINLPVIGKLLARPDISIDKLNTLAAVFEKK